MPKQKSRTPLCDYNDVTLGSPAFLKSGPVTFCPYLTIGLAFLLFWTVEHKIKQISTEETGKE